MLSASLACVLELPTIVSAEAGQRTPVDAAPQGASDGTANVLFRNGAIYTVAPGYEWAEAVAVTNETITYVGSEAGAKSQIGPKTKIVDLKGRLLMPGFIEAHTHPFLGAFFASGVDLQFPAREGALDAIAAFAKSHPAGLVRGFGWRMDMFGPEGPTAAELDRIVPDRPAMMFAIDCHSLWVNTKAMEMAGITRSTRDPIPGFSFYQRDANGNPTGFVLEVPAMIPVVHAIEPITMESIAGMLGSWLPKAAGAGITAIFDAAVPPIGNGEGDLIQIYADFEERNELPFRVVACHAVKGPPIDKAVARTNALRQRFHSPLVEARAMKIVTDGTPAGWTAFMLEPYADKPDSRGSTALDQQQLTDLIKAADAADIDVHCHACGDATVRMLLDAMEEAIKSNPHRDRRNAIAHLVFVDDADMPRFAKLGVTGQFSINWHSHDPDSVETSIARCGAERQARIYRPRAQLKAGGRISAGTDWPAAGYYSTYKPLEAIQIGMTRKMLGKSAADPCLTSPAECLTLEEALAAYTLGAAYQLRLEHKVGSIEVGKSADLIVVRENLFKLPPSEIGKAFIDMTMMRGVVTHGKAA